MSLSWKSQVRVGGSSDWQDNPLRFATADEATNAGPIPPDYRAVTAFQVVQSDDPVNYTYTARGRNKFHMLGRSDRFVGYKRSIAFNKRQIPEV